MSSRGSKHNSGKSSTPQSSIPQPHPNLSIPHVTTTCGPSIPIPKVVRPSLSFVPSPQLHDIATRSSLPPQMHGSVVRPTISPRFSDHRIDSSPSFSSSPSSSQVPPPEIPTPGTESSHPLTPQGASGGLSPRGRDPVDGRIWIYPESATFTPAVCTVRQILPLIQAKFDHPCYSWKVTPNSYKQM
ncbi:hypothetical protein QN277_023022 [Acacia crassicarpa]|uniref:Uncharacterized protein n=1 Tax=Acacia crassicarpa TaxID=499986 RepID=A0AAE1JI33_9FABA|nr:hypothetical protein QN277_023022 [Acacia crassicarpa]